MAYVVTHRVLDTQELEEAGPEATLPNPEDGEPSWGYCDQCREEQAPPEPDRPRCQRCGGWLLEQTYV